MSDIIVGTVRGKNKDGSYVVVQRDGRRADVHFRSGAPMIGSDVIGNLSAGEDGRVQMSLYPSVLDAMLDGTARFIPLSKRPDLTARILAKMLERSKSAVFKPGGGMSIERTPHSDDPDIRWAMDNFKPEAERLGLALNVIDVKSVTRSPWDMKSLQNFSLPADIEGSRRSKDELTKILRSGFHPACSRIVEKFTGTNEISVNFVIPYSPFSGSVGFARDIARMHIGVFPLVSMNISETRRLSSAKQMALAIAHNRLSVGKGFQADLDTHPRVRHLSNCFADAAASLVFLARGGRPEVIEEYALLKEASVFFGYDEGLGGLKAGVLEQATHRSVRAAIDWYSEQGDASMSVKDLVTRAVRIAKATAYEGLRFADASAVTEQELLGAVNSANMIAADLPSATREYIEQLGEKYRDDLDALVQEHVCHPVAAQRLMTFGAVHVPDRLERVFSEMTEPLADLVRQSATETVEADRSSMLNAVAGRLASSRHAPMEFGYEERPLAVRTP
ncbi:hypothetical protein OIU34_18275 [Pararhizobium sp. BT-229]|uniref:hypothetical protein n=1 Tax=Pararhizobium sp. BT-229 TaxID=2986923 RepID=UPI0021F70806|nr:hypothetical protein [Pararhizobium sp. BT-229]MCV9963827.1 hypothetical protein [Pararhizobium sp. BT-229]